MKYVMWFVALVLFAPTILVAQTSPTDVSIGPVRNSNLQPFNFLFVERQVTRGLIADAAKTEVPKILQAMADAHIKQRGPVVLTYRDLPADPNKEFDLDIGVMVAGNPDAPA